MTTIDVKNAKAIKNLTNNKEIIKISDPNDPTKIYWQKNTNIVVTYIINTGVASITIVGNDGVTYVNASSAGGSVNIPKGITITCSATVQTGYNTISNTTRILDGDYEYSPTTTLLKYTVTLSSTYGHWENLSGTTVTSISNVPYGTYISKSGQRISVDGSSYNFVVNSATAQYNYTFSSITIPSSTVTDNMTIKGTATRSTRYYSLTFQNDSSNTVTAYFRIGSGSWSSYSVSGQGSRSISTYYNNSISVYFTYGNATSSTITRTMTSDQSVAGDCSSSSSRQWSPISKPSWDGDSTEWFGQQLSGFYAWDGGGNNPFSRSSSCNHIRIVRSNGYTWLAPIPSSLPYSIPDNYMSLNSTADGGDGSGQTVYFHCEDRGDEDTEMFAFVGVVGNFGMYTMEYGTYDWVTTYSVWWN